MGRDTAGRDRRGHNTHLPDSAWDGLGAEISAKIETLAAITDEPGKLTRLYLNPAHRRSVDVVMAWMREAGLETRLDATGTVIGRLAGTGAMQKTLLIGSHIDTVRDAGKYDGTLGVLAALAVVGRLTRHGVRMPFDIDVVAFGDEEGVRFPSTLSGSRALAGKFDPKILDEADQAGLTRRDGLVAFGCDPMAGAAVALDPKRVLGYIEVHIEQGPVLESRNLSVGVVTAISGANRGRVVIRGESGHAGTVPMSLRKDALATAAEIVLAVEARARTEKTVVATVGRLDVANSAVNTVPGLVELTLDVRAPSDVDRKRAVTEITREIAAIAERRRVVAEISFTYEANAVESDAMLVEALAGAVTRQGIELIKLPSGAGHDAMSFGGCIPAAMLFVRCRGGISHSPLEYASDADMDAAARVLLDFVATLGDAA